VTKNNYKNAKRMAGEQIFIIFKKKNSIWLPFRRTGCSGCVGDIVRVFPV